MPIGLDAVGERASSLLQRLATERRCRRSRQAAMRAYELILQRGCRPVDRYAQTNRSLCEGALRVFEVCTMADCIYRALRRVQGGMDPGRLFVLQDSAHHQPACDRERWKSKDTDEITLRSPSSPDIVSRVDGSWISKNGEILNQEQARALAFNATDYVYFKADDQDKGHGIRIADKDEFDHVCKQWTTDFVVQFPVEQHRDLSRFHAGSVATLRILTYKRPACSPAILSAHLRFARGDWRYVSSRGNPIRVAMNRDTGTLRGERRGRVVESAFCAS